ncbi:hypothetical protein DPMN_137754 [Dreissena polymorpha]|uniref:Uncharacterized protein n=1 Tax=Dreissena polymorpha TaxID=45954 RepID=A0A9D4JDY8_DREPO|nr:hypothetical protein DPMN_137754 [Dreissena polymorpha]
MEIATSLDPDQLALESAINILTKFHKDWMKTTSLLTKFHEDWMKIRNDLTKFHKDWMKTVTSTVYTNKLLTYNPKPDFIKINILTKFYKDWMKTVTSNVYTNKLLTDARTHARTHNGHRTSHGHISSPCHFVTEPPTFYKGLKASRKRMASHLKDCKPRARFECGSNTFNHKVC